MAQFNVTLTNGGAGVLAKCIGGKQLVFTKMSMGDGRYSGQSQDAAALVSVKANLTIAKITVKDGTATIRSVLQYKSVETGFTWREIGLFARDPDTQAEVLYAYGNAGEQGDYIPGSSEATLDEKIINIRAMISSAANVTAVIDESLVFATQQDLSAHEDNTNIHVTAEQKASWDAKETPEGAQAKADQAKADAEAASIPLTAKGQANGVASLDGTGKVPSAQLPAMNYDPAGSAAAVDAKLTAHSGDTVNHITAAERTTWNSKATTVTYTASVTTTWTTDSTNGGYYQTVTVNGMLATDNPIADIILGSDVDANALYTEAWGLVSRISTGTNNIILYANGDAPTIAFTVQLKVVR